MISGGGVVLLRSVVIEDFFRFLVVWLLVDPLVQLLNLWFDLVDSRAC